MILVLRLWWHVFLISVEWWRVVLSLLESSVSPSEIRWSSPCRWLKIVHGTTPATSVHRSRSSRPEGAVSSGHCRVCWSSTPPSPTGKPGIAPLIIHDLDCLSFGTTIGLDQIQVGSRFNAGSHKQRIDGFEENL